MFNFSKQKATKHFCRRCLHCFSSKNLLERHGTDCLELNGSQAITMPPEGSKISFGNFFKTQPAPFVIYADFEAITEKLDSCQPPNDKSFTTTYQSHQACSYGYKGWTIRKVMGGVGKKTKKIHARENAKKKNSCKEEGKKKLMRKEGPTPGPAILISIINKDI